MKDWLAMYRQRDKLVGPMPEPQWRMLLDLACNGPSAVTSLCIASGAPATTALRHIGILRQWGLLERRADENDARRCWLSISAAGVEMLLPFAANDCGEGA